MIETRFTQLFDVSVPIQLAAMPGVSTPELVAAVSEAGGLGMLGTGAMSPEALSQAIGAVAERTSRAFGVNFLMPFLNRECLDVAARTVRLVEFFYGDPDSSLVETAHAAGARVSWQVGSPAEALAAERAGCDIVVAQGTEAGGHVRGTTSLLPLLSQVIDTVALPVVAAGGIATARDLAGVLACGASAARIGTRFLATPESGAHPAYVQALLAAEADDTCLTEAFSVLWPNAPHRVLRSAIIAAEALTEDTAGALEVDGVILQVPRLSVFPPSRDATGHVEAMALYAGESVANVREVRPAAEIVAEMAAGAERLLARRSG